VASRRGPDNSVRVAITGTISAQNFANIFRCQLSTSGSISQADLDTWTLAFFNAYKAQFQAIAGSGVAVLNAKAVLYAPGNTELISSQGVAYNGTGSPATGPGAASEVISWLSNVYWRGGKPRTYLPGVLSASLNSGTDTLTSTRITALKAAAAAFRTAVNALTATSITSTVFGFVSFRTGNAERGTPLFFAIVGSNVHPRVGIQRRRDGRWLN
jgi:hypothetical protein